MCGANRLAGTSRLAEPRREPHRRVGDDERRAAEDVLGQAWSLGYLRRDELDARIDRVLAAVSRADLDGVLADLPMDRLRRADPRRREARLRAARLGLRVHGLAVVVASALVTAVWTVVAVATGAWFPWFVFPVVGGGLGVAGHAAVVRLCTSRPGPTLRNLRTWPDIRA